MLKESRVNEAPVPVLEIVQSYGVEVLEADFGADSIMADIAGLLDFERKKIFVPHKDPFNRKSFTIAQLLGHFLLHKEKFADGQFGMVMRRPIGATDDPLGAEANTFAAHLMVPTRLMDKYLKYATIADLAQIFAVPPDVIRFRSEPANAGA